MNDKKYDPKLLHLDRFPKTAKHELEWMLANEMGPNPLWFLEDLLARMTLRDEPRILDMGCGRATTSVFLAKELRARVWAHDLWISPDDNWARVVEAGLEDRICPIRTEARALPYAAGFFDAVISVDSYQYYGTDDLYLGYISRFVRDGGAIGLVMPGMTREIDEPPEHLTRPREGGKAFWDPAECRCFHTLDWWVRHVSGTGLVTVEDAWYVEDGWKLWRDWEIIRDGGGFTGFPSEAPAIEEDRGRYLGFVSLVLEKLPRAPSPFGHSIDIRL